MELRAKTVCCSYNIQYDHEELNVYCRENGLYPDQIKEWKTECLYGQEQAEANQKIKEAEESKKKNSLTNSRINKSYCKLL